MPERRCAMSADELVITAVAAGTGGPVGGSITPGVCLLREDVEQGAVGGGAALRRSRRGRVKWWL